MSNKRKVHAGHPVVNSVSNKGNDTQRMIGNYVLHPSKGWRRISIVNMLKYQNKIATLINKAVFKTN